jgi:hypothetical protein
LDHPAFLLQTAAAEFGRTIIYGLLAKIITQWRSGYFNLAANGHSDEVALTEGSDQDTPDDWNLIQACQKFFNDHDCLTISVSTKEVR